MKKEFLEQLIGTTSPGTLAASLVWAAIGILFVLLYGTTRRDPDSTGSPKKFYWSYLFSDNAKRIYASLIAVCISLRFAPQIFSFELQPWYGLVIGTFWDSAAFIIKQKTGLLDPSKK